MILEEWIGLFAAFCALLFVAAILAIAVEGPEIKHPLDDKWED